MPKGSPPDYKIMARLNRDPSVTGEIGAGWKNDDGSIQIKFNPFVVVPVGNEYALRLFPNNRVPGPTPAPRTPVAAPAQKRFGDMEDDVPF